MSAKMGRPTDNPQPNKVSMRITDKEKEILDKYCEQNNVNRTVAIRRAIVKLEDDIKK